MKKQIVKKDNKKKLMANSLIEIILNTLKYVVMFTLSILIYAGYKIYLEAQPTESLVTWSWVSISILLICLFIYLLITIKAKNSLLKLSFIILILPWINGDIIWIYKLSMVSFIVGTIYEILIMFGMKIRYKIFWRNKEILK
ncbi:MAG: hypothetical protein IH964_11090 [Candidatus Dadabacteria bacterium]|nr:hypothetical protein [Candidatus Dadabacteria bacterium]